MRCHPFSLGRKTFKRPTSYKADLPIKGFLAHFSQFPQIMDGTVNWILCPSVGLGRMI